MKTIWKIDPSHSQIGFKVKHMMISTVSGGFSDFEATIEADGEQFDGAAIQFKADTASIQTGSNDRDTHLKSADFFDADTYPEIRFESTHFDGSSVTGNLTIKDVTKKVTFQVENNGIAVDPYGQTKAGFEVTGAIHRKDFGLNWNAVTEAGSIVVSNEVKLQGDLQFIKQPSA